MKHQVRRGFGFWTESATSARHFVESVVEEWGGDPAAVGLVASELVANAIKQSGARFTVAVCHDGDHVIIEVEDRSESKPVLLSPSAEDPSGRGLVVVDALAEEWGVRSSLDGKVVWARLPARQV